MFKRLITLFKLGRKLAKSDALTIVSKFNKPPLLVTVIFKLFSFSFTKKDSSYDNLSEGEKLSNSLASMGTTFIKLGQFLSTRPDIIGEALSTQLEKLQDRLPPFSVEEAKEMASDIQNQIEVEEYKILFSSRKFKKTRVEYFVEHEFNIEKSIPA